MGRINQAKLGKQQLSQKKAMLNLNSKALQTKHMISIAQKNSAHLGGGRCARGVQQYVVTVTEIVASLPNNEIRDITYVELRIDILQRSNF